MVAARVRAQRVQRAAAEETLRAAQQAEAAQAAMRNSGAATTQLREQVEQQLAAKEQQLAAKDAELRKVAAAAEKQAEKTRAEVDGALRELWEAAGRIAPGSPPPRPAGRCSPRARDKQRQAAGAARPNFPPWPGDTAAALGRLPGLVAGEAAALRRTADERAQAAASAQRAAEQRADAAEQSAKQAEARAQGQAAEAEAAQAARAMAEAAMDAMKMEREALEEEAESVRAEAALAKAEAETAGAWRGWAETIASLARTCGDADLSTQEIGRVRTVLGDLNNIAAQVGSASRRSIADKLEPFRQYGEYDGVFGDSSGDPDASASSWRSLVEKFGSDAAPPMDLPPAKRTRYCHRCGYGPHVRLQQGVLRGRRAQCDRCQFPLYFGDDDVPKSPEASPRTRGKWQSPEASPRTKFVTRSPPQGPAAVLDAQRPSLPACLPASPPAPPAAVPAHPPPPARFRLPYGERTCGRGIPGPPEPARSHPEPSPFATPSCPPLPPTEHPRHADPASLPLLHGGWPPPPEQQAAGVNQPPVPRAHHSWATDGRLELPSPLTASPGLPLALPHPSRGRRASPPRRSAAAPAGGAQRKHAVAPALLPPRRGQPEKGVPGRLGSRATLSASPGGDGEGALGLTHARLRLPPAT